MIIGTGTYLPNYTMLHQKMTIIFIFFFTDTHTHARAHTHARTHTHTQQLISPPTYTVNSETVSKNCVTATKLQYNLVFQRYVYFNGKLKFKKAVLIKQNIKIM